MNIDSLETLLDQKRYESARLVCEDVLRAGVSNAAIRWMLYRAYRGLADLRAAMRLLEDMPATTDDERFELHLRRAEDLHQLSGYSFYRDSVESRVGLTGEEYELKYQRAGRAEFEFAKPLAKSTDQRRKLILSLRQCKYIAEADSITAELADDPTAPIDRNSDLVALANPQYPTANGTLAGTLRFQGGVPVADAVVTLGFAVDVIAADPTNYLGPGFGDDPTVGPQESLTCRTNGRGEFNLSAPAGKHAFVAVTLDAERYDIATRFLAHGVTIFSGQETRLDLSVGEWTSAAPKPFEPTLSAEIMFGGRSFRRAHVENLRNPFHFDFPRQLITLSRSDGANADRLLIGSDSPTMPIAFQIIDGRVAFFAELPAMTEKTFALYEAIDATPHLWQGRTAHDSAPAEWPTGSPPVPRMRKDLSSGTLPEDRTINAAVKWIVADNGESITIDSGRAQFRLPGSLAAIDAPPLLAVCGEDAVWRGRGRFVLPAGVRILSRSTELLTSGPLVLSARVSYHLTNGNEYAITFTAHAGEAYLLAHEVSPALDDGVAAFEFSLRDFAGGRGFLHWTPEDGTSVHWTTLDRRARELARLQESIAWWIPPCGFAYAMTKGRTNSRDYVGVFTIRRGEWIDRQFERLAQGPGDDGRELDWPYPEMIGSTISMVTAHTSDDGDAFFRFRFFDGERRWGILVSTLDRNDGPYKELSAVQHKCSSPRLDDFKRWRLDEADTIARPFVVSQRKDLRALRKKKHSPRFARLWERIARPNASGAAAGLRFAIDGDPTVAWRKKLEIVAAAKIRSRMVLLGRDYSDMYSPVGARPLTPWVEEYDLIAASGVFTPEEERLVRQFFMLMGHMFMERDFMNWKYNSRNANFEADRTDVVGAIGLAFHGNPDAKTFVDHAAELMERSINIYCTPGSGKWYENPACYYLHAAKCRMNLAFHLASHGIMNPTKIARLKDFLRWGVLLLQPNTPHEYELMRDGARVANPQAASEVSSSERDRIYRTAEQVRRIAPVGDHAYLGPWVPDHYALLSKLYRPSDHALADLLLWAWQTGGEDGSYYGNAVLVFAALDEADIEPVPPPTLISRRLEGFGAVFRGQFDRPDEFFLLFKQGPGGYRYHRTEGSFILFANGQPLIYDGGEAGETWRHSTLSFHNTHMPLAAGHVERFASLPSVDFCQGVHPVALRPGDPVFLSDKCDHTLIDLAYARFAEPKPADSRSVWWIKDEYVIVHDELRLEPDVLSHWHLQVVSDESSGSAQKGFLFKGRYGTDLQVLLPDQMFTAESIEQTPMLDYKRSSTKTFSMRHLQLSATSPDHCLAILRPIFGSRKPIHASPIKAGDAVRGVHVQGDGLDDRLIFSRQRISQQGDGFSFDGCYGALLSRKDSRALVLLDGRRIEWNGIVIESTGAAVELWMGEAHASLTITGAGRVRLSGYGPTKEWELRGETTQIHILR